MSPSLPTRRCTEPRCPNTAPFGFTRCTAHGGATRKQGPRERGYEREWELRAKAYLVRDLYHRSFGLAAELDETEASSRIAAQFGSGEHESRGGPSLH
jgi:hypothetical protein